MIILVAIPVYDRKVQIETVQCLMNEQIHAAVNGDALQVRFLPSCSHPAMGRNQLVHEFLESNADRLVFLDSDVTFEAGDLVKLANYDYPLVGGAYRYKTDFESYPVTWLKEKELWSNKDGLIEVETLPTGFMSISRSVFEHLRKQNPEKIYAHQGKTVHCFFEMPFKDGSLYGEDSFFCMEWRKAGGQVFLDPSLTLTHWEINKPYIGNIGNWLKSRMEAA